MKTILIIVVALLVVSYLGFNLRDMASSPTARDNFGFAWEWVLKGWDYIKAGGQYFYDTFIMRLDSTTGAGEHNKFIKDAIDNS